MPKHKKHVTHKKRTSKDPVAYYGFKSTHIIIGITGLLAVVLLLGSNGLVGGQSMVLGEKNEAEKQAQEQAKEAEKQQKEAQKENEKRTQEIQKEEMKQQKEAAKENKKTIQESKKTASPTAKIKTKIEDSGRAKFEMEQGKLKVKYEVKDDGKVEFEAEDEQGEAVELSNSLKQKFTNEVEDELADDGVEIATGSGERILVKNKMGATSQFPLSIDVATKQLIVTTPAGQKVVTVLPDQAIANMLRVGKVTILNTTPESSTSATPNFETVAKLEVRNNEMVYRIQGAKKQRLFGLIPITTDVTAFVSAESGEPAGEEQSLLGSVVDLLSP